MTENDAVLSALRALPVETPPVALTQKLKASGRARLVPARVHALWGVAVAASVAAYLGWALVFTGRI